MSEQKIMDEPLVFGLDIGTRNVVGTVGYRIDDNFIVVAQYMREHETRAMLDGQIHDIGRVGKTIRKVKEQLESQLGLELTEVCIAAAGRVLKTVTTNIECAFEEETLVTGEDIHTLDLMGIEKAQGLLKEYNDTRYKFYCVGYSVMHYYLNGEPFSSLESHKADVISEDIIVTFLPEDVVDGLYAAVGLAGLSVANMTLEPIAAINVAIPENFRLLNIALVDIGAGTSDICITRDGSIIAYGMIPLAGDEITELIVQNYLVDFRTAESIKAASGKGEDIVYKDIMLIEHTIPAEDVWELTEPVVERMTTEVAAKIMELNGDKTVSATFIVGGGGKIHGYAQKLAQKLNLPEERVALRGEEVLQEVIFEQEEIEKDPLLVTPIGICLNYFDQKNSFIMVRFNGERVKLYDNNKLTVVDVALAAGFPNEDLFPKRGRELQFTVDGAKRVVRGKPGESAVIFMNDRPANINTPLEPNSDIIIEASTQGEDALCTLEQLEEYSGAAVAFIVNGKIVRCPRFLEVNGSLELPSYQIQENDNIETRGFYTVGQLVEFMDVELDMEHEILVNNRPATLETLIYENFSIEWVVLSYGAAYVEAPKWQEETAPEAAQPTVTQEDLAKVQAQAVEAAETLNGMLAEIVTDPDLPETYKTYGIAGASVAGALQTQKLAGREPAAKPLERARQDRPAREKERTKQEQPVRDEERTKQEQPARDEERTRQGERARRERAAQEMTERKERVQERRTGRTEPKPAAPGSAVSILEDMERLHDELRARMIQKAKDKEQQEAKSEKEPEEKKTGKPSAEPVQEQKQEQEPGNVEELIAMLSAGNPDTPNQGAVKPMTTASVRPQPKKDSVERPSEPALAGEGPATESAKQQTKAAPMWREPETEPHRQPTKAESETEPHRQPTKAEPETEPHRQPTKAEPETELLRQQTKAAPMWTEPKQQQPETEAVKRPSAPAAAEEQSQPVTEPAGRMRPQREEALGAIKEPVAAAKTTDGQSAGAGESAAAEQQAAEARDLHIFINGEPVTLQGRQEYIFVNVFDVYEFDLSEARGREIVTLHNGFQAKYTDELNEGDKIELRWKERE